MEKCFSCGHPMDVIKDKPYEYTESGLKVLLLGITQYRCKDCGEEFAAIPKVDLLHKLIGIDLCKNRKGLLLPAEIKFLRKEMNQKAVDLARALGVTASTVSRWENDKKPISEGHDRFLRLLYLSCYDDHESCDESSCNLLDVFKSLPKKRKAIREPHPISYNPQEWMMKGGACVPA